MDDDFFKDLVPIKAASVNRAASKNHETSSIFSDDTVLSAVPDGKPSAEHIRNESNDTLPHPMTGRWGAEAEEGDSRDGISKCRECSSQPLSVCWRSTEGLGGRATVRLPANYALTCYHSVAELISGSVRDSVLCISACP